jgi:hypothetical protein
VEAKEDEEVGEKGVSKTCINHPNIPVYVYDKLCESIWCELCFDIINKSYQDAYKIWSEHFEEKKKVEQNPLPQNCTFCNNPESFLSVNTCCTGCSKLPVSNTKEEKG